jgi:hypothetical protein
MSLSVDTTMRVVSPLQRRVDIDAASRLRLDSDVVHTVVLTRLHEDVPFEVTTIYLSPATARLLEDAPELRADTRSTATVIGLLDPHLEHPITEAA